MLTRRAYGAATLGLMACTGAAADLRPAAAQPQQPAPDYPSRPVTIVVPYPAGGSTDAVARILAQRLSTDLHRPFVVENRAGANGTIAAAHVARSRPDGYTLLWAPASVFAMAPHVFQTQYDNDRGFVGVGLAASMPIFMAVPKDFPARTVREFVDLAKRPGGRILYANAASGSSTHLATELFLQMAGVDVPEIGYRGGAAALQAVMANEAQMVFLAASGILPQIQSGDVRALAVTTRERSPLAPEVPTFAEAGFPDYEVVEQIAMLAPAGTPEPVLRRLNAAIAAAMDAPETRERLRPLGVTPTVGTVDEFPAYFAAENAKWREVIRSRNIRVQ